MRAASSAILAAAGLIALVMIVGTWSAIVFLNVASQP